MCRYIFLDVIIVVEKSISSDGLFSGHRVGKAGWREGW